MYKVVPPPAAICFSFISLLTLLSLLPAMAVLSEITFSDQETTGESGVYKRNVTVKEEDTESVLSDPKIGVVESDFKQKQVRWVCAFSTRADPLQTFKGWTLLWLAYQATGVIYGDIGMCRAFE